MILVTLCSAVGIVLLPMQGITGDTRAKTAATRVHKSSADAESTEIDAGNDRHKTLPQRARGLGCVRIHFPAKIARRGFVNSRSNRGEVRSDVVLEAIARNESEERTQTRDLRDRNPSGMDRL